ncbi:MAG: NADPH-dependent assimilatory sulfite reductase hemoprotein subunit [Myxococcota bacterium]
MAERPPAEAVTLLNSDVSQMSKVEKLKVESEGLFFVAGRERQPFAAEIDAMAEGRAQTLSNEAKEISKHFGIYKQQERIEGRKSGDYIFMVRLKLPAGGELSPAQWGILNEAAERYGNGTLRLTTRQGIQFHYVSGKNLGALVRHLAQQYETSAQLSTLGACGDVNRNTMCSPIDDLDPELPLDSRALAIEIARELAPRSSAYVQIFLSDDEGRLVAPMSAEEPIYGRHYLPRKFKIGIAHPHDNSVDVLTQDVGLVPVIENGRAARYELYSGGGLGVTHNNPQTQALLGLYLGRIPREQVVETARAIAILQKENGERKNRRQARWKYTIRRLGVAQVKQMLRERFGLHLEDAEPQPVPPVRFFHGWHREATRPEAGARRFLGLPVLSGRLQDADGMCQKTAVRKIVSELGPHGVGVRITGNQDLLLTHIPEERRDWVEGVLAEHGVPREVSNVRRQSFACPAKPTCGLAMTDAEHVLPQYIRALEEAGLGDADVVLRMAGCPNSCSRPPSAEVGIIGYGKNDHIIQVGGSRSGTRIGRVLYERVPEHEMIPVLVGLFRAIREHERKGIAAESFLHDTPVEELRKLVGHQE